MSLQAQRSLGAASSAFENSLNRLSSGSRINRASDDAAGLAVASSLNVQARVLNQGVRNVNDGISAVNIAGDAIANLKVLTVRIQELAIQSSNGVLSNRQRAPLDKEAQALVDEFQRIVETTTFNGTKLFDRNTTSLSLQVGNDALSLALGESETVGNGTFYRAATAAFTGVAVTACDLDLDGNTDQVSAASGQLAVRLGNGNGTFEATISFSSLANPQAIAIDDLNNDGIADVVIGRDSGSVATFLGNGDGTFQAFTSRSYAGSVEGLALADLDGDGNKDIVLQSVNSQSVNVAYGLGTGSFSTAASFYAGVGGQAVNIVDVNNDGRLDIVGRKVFLNNGSRSFTETSPGSIIPASYGSLVTTDLNNDGKVDIVTAPFDDPGYLQLYLGAGNGTFTFTSSFAAGRYTSSVRAADFNSDGYLDLASSEGSSGTGSLQIRLGNGNGTFGAAVSLAGYQASNVVITDLNNDSITDIFIASIGSGSSVYFGNGSARTSFLNADDAPDVDLSTLYSAKLSIQKIDRALTTLSSHAGALGAAMSRMNVAASVLHTSADVTKAAESRIVDVDVAQESANLLSSQIIQQAAASVLAHANQQPALVLKLLQT